MLAFEKINDIVEKCADKEKLVIVNVVINKERIKNYKYGRYIQTTWLRFHPHAKIVST